MTLISATRPSHQQTIRRTATYNDGQPYRTARGQVAPQQTVVDHNTTVHPIVTGKPTATEFLAAVRRELKIRCYQPNTIKNYTGVLRNFLAWFGNRPHLVTLEDVRSYLEVLVDGGGKSDWIAQNLSAIRTAFDKFCGRSVTLGLATPRKPRRMPTVISEPEVRRILEAAHSLRDKLLIGLMYATGMRISEVTRLRWQDIDFDRRTVSVWQAKGRSDRQVTLPGSFEPLLRSLAQRFSPTDFVFPGERPGRHISPRTGGRIVARATALAGIGKKVTPHTFRHAFATHLLEHGTDIRFIQKLLGHVRLETTTIYTKVAIPRTETITSPLDRIASRTPPTPRPAPTTGCLRIATVHADSSSASFNIEIYSNRSAAKVVLKSVILQRHAPGWIAMHVPPFERWQHQLSKLDPECRARVESPDFYRFLQTELTKRFSGT